MKRKKIRQRQSELKYNFYCRLCWQEFDHINQHNTGSWYDNEKLNGKCEGDIRPQLDRINDIKIYKENSLSLPFEK